MLTSTQPYAEKTGDVPALGEKSLLLQAGEGAWALGVCVYVD